MTAPPALPLGGLSHALCLWGLASIEANPPNSLDPDPPSPVLLANGADINDVRIAVELRGPVSYFFSCWELADLNWPPAIIPDAVFRIGDHTFAVEFDRGFENIPFFMRTKMAAYRPGLDGLPLTAPLVATDCRAWLETLAKAIADEPSGTLYSTIDLVREHGIAAPVFYRRPFHQAAPLV